MHSLVYKIVDFLQIYFLDAMNEKVVRKLEGVFGEGFMNIKPAFNKNEIL